MPSFPGKQIVIAIAVGSAACFIGCSGNHAPVLQPIADQTATVGVELSIELRATDADGDSLSFDFDAPSIPDIHSRAEISAFADDVAIFRWTPAASDQSDSAYPFDFKVSDGKATATETVQITVSGAAGSAPVFREPLGTGTTLDLSMQMCIDVLVTIDDTAATTVTISELDPQIDGSMLTQTDDFDATWHWCPSDAQIAAQDQYVLHLGADDGTNQATKDYLIVLRAPTQMNCPGTPPVITHSPPPAQSTLLDLTITADISDDVGLDGAPLLYYSTTAPPTPPDLTMMQQAAMALSAGDMLSGTYQGTIPNPVASAAPGTQATIYYLIEARDDDDPTGACDHVTDAPPTGTFSVDVTAPSGGGTLMACAACSSDTQCAPTYDCVVIGTGGDTFCSRECTGSPPCPTGYNCSTGTLTSVGGKVSRFCRPKTMTCTP